MISPRKAYMMVKLLDRNQINVSETSGFLPQEFSKFERLIQKLATSHGLREEMRRNDLTAERLREIAEIYKS